MTVLFTSVRPLKRAENIKAVYDKYQGKKEFVKSGTPEGQNKIQRKKYDVVVGDELLQKCASPFITIGHGIGGGKKYGFDQRNTYHTKAGAELITYAVIASEAMVDGAAKQLGIPKEKVLPLGFPRTDQYFGAKKGDGKTEYADSKMYLYAPTFETQTYEMTNWSSIDDMLSDDETLIIKPHMVVGDLEPKEYYRHIKFVSPQEPSAPYLIDCDVCVTDYSSIMFDAYVLQKPVVLFAKDWDFYKYKRGMYFNYPEDYSSYHARTGWAMVEACRKAEYEPGKYDKFLGRCDGHSTERVIEVIKEFTKNGERKRSKV